MSRELCTYGPPNERQQYWILKFEDADVDDMHFRNSDEAYAAFRRYTTAWNCTLFCIAELNDAQ